MSSRTALTPRDGDTHHWIGWLLTISSFAALAVTDLRFSHGLSLSSLYIGPVAIGAWYLGVPVAIVLAILATGTRYVSALICDSGTTVAGWNAGMTFGVLISVALLVDALFKPRRDLRIARLIWPGVVGGLFASLFLISIGPIATPEKWRRGMSRASLITRTNNAANDSLAIMLPKPTNGGPLARLQAQYDVCKKLSRSVLLGSRDITKGSCVELIKSGQLIDRLPPNKGDLDGGPGTMLAVLLHFDRQNVHSAIEEYNWHQSRLMSYFDNELQSNQIALLAAEEFYANAQALADEMRTSSSLPRDLTPAGSLDRETWPGYCLSRLSDAVKAKDLSASKRWSEELASAAFWQADLHRWLAFLTSNFQAAIRFQALCYEEFEQADRSNDPYNFATSPSNLPGGILTLHGIDNFLELERQAERIFTMPPDRAEELENDKNLTEANIWIPPASRDVFVELQGVLSPENVRTLIDAAHTPFASSYLKNMLFRMETAETIQQQKEVLHRLNGLNPHASMADEMSVLMYRGHSFAGIEWADRFLPQLMDESAELPKGKPVDVFFAACLKSHEVFAKGGKYGVTFSLRNALDQGMLDCVRATDLAVDLFRNSGRPNIGHVRLTAATAGHAVAAYLGDESNGNQVVVSDPLKPGDTPQKWPDAYFHGATWPEFLQNNPAPSAAELYVRGLDSYVWAEGYVIRGKYAGTLVKTPIPYLPGRQAAENAQVYSEPYPE